MTQASDKDQVFARPLAEIKAFEFNDAVTQVFRDMISRSVPGYDLLLRMIGLYANIFVQDNSRVYDLGCSLGDVAQIVANQASATNFDIIAVDNSPSMIKKCRELDKVDPEIDWQCTDIEDINIEQASMVILNLTLVFFNQSQRQALLERIYQGLKPDGVLVLTEKIHMDETDYDNRMIQLYQAFKKTQGYSELEISQKRTALENVQVPDRDSDLKDRLVQAGFDEIYPCFRCFNFVSYLAIKV